MGKAAAAVEVPEFRPEQGVKIETDPNATTVAHSSMTDDEGVIQDLIDKLQALPSISHPASPFSAPDMYMC